MKAFVLKDDRGEVVRAWLVRFGSPHLSLAERDIIERSGRLLEEIPIDEALSCAGYPQQLEHQNENLAG